MCAVNNLQRFLDAQQDDYNKALAEIYNCRKRSHWMWYIFPQVEGLGVSSTSRFYAIHDLHEATSYLQHPLLGKRLVEISIALLACPGNDAYHILGSPDDMKLQSSMTLFAMVENSSPVFEKVLEKFFNGIKDQKTINVIVKQV